MRPVGYSTGALAPGDVPRAVALLSGRARAVELSALRLHELAPLLSALPGLDQDLAETAWATLPTWVISILRGLACSATGMTMVSTPSW